MREDALAGPLALGGVALMLYSCWGYPPLQRLIGTKRLAQLGFAMVLPLALAIPTASLVVRHHYHMSQVGGSALCCVAGGGPMNLTLFQWL
jgi:hypothetical protein